MRAFGVFATQRARARAAAHERRSKGDNGRAQLAKLVEADEPPGPLCEHFLRGAGGSGAAAWRGRLIHLRSLASECGPRELSSAISSRVYKLGSHLQSSPVLSSAQQLVSTFACARPKAVRDALQSSSTRRSVCANRWCAPLRSRASRSAARARPTHPDSRRSSSDCCVHFCSPTLRERRFSINELAEDGNQSAKQDPVHETTVAIQRQRRESNGFKLGYKLRLVRR